MKEFSHFRFARRTGRRSRAAVNRYIGHMKPTRFSFFVLAFLCIGTLVMAAEERAFDPELAKRLGADERGMKMYVLCILKSGPKDAEVAGEERKKIFAGHFANRPRSSSCSMPR